MAMTRTLGWGIVGAGTTMLARSVVRRAMHEQSGAPRLPYAVQGSNSFAMMLALAVATGALLAIGDVLLEQRKRVVRAHLDSFATGAYPSQATTGSRG